MAVVYENDLVLATSVITHSLMAREANITYAMDDAGKNWSAQQWADELQLQFQTNLKAFFQTECSLRRTETIKGDGTSTFTTGTSTAAATAGTTSAACLPPNSAVLVRANTGMSGRTNRGRNYFPWWGSEGNVDEAGLITAGDVTSFQTGVTAWLTALNAIGGGSNRVIANRVYSAPWTDPSRVLTNVNIGPPVISLTVETYIASQRRRLVRP